MQFNNSASIKYDKLYIFKKSLDQSPCAARFSFSSPLALAWVAAFLPDGSSAAAEPNTGRRLSQWEHG